MSLLAIRDMNKDMHTGRNHGKIKSNSVVKRLQKPEPRLGKSFSSISAGRWPWHLKVGL